MKQTLTCRAAEECFFCLGSCAARLFLLGLRGSTCKKACMQSSPSRQKTQVLLCLAPRGCGGGEGEGRQLAALEVGALTVNDVGHEENGDRNEGCCLGTRFR